LPGNPSEAAEDAVDLDRPFELDENVPGTHNREFPKLRVWKVVRNSLPIHLIRPAFSCFSKAKSKDLNSLVLIPFYLARDARGRFAKGSSDNP
jgi:hypothetical protein